MSIVEYFDRTLPATLAAVDALCCELRVSVIAWLPANERFAVELLLREALTNACGTAQKVRREPVFAAKSDAFPAGW
jgi:hypothetical protein